MQSIVVVCVWTQAASLSAEHALVANADDAFSKSVRLGSHELSWRDQATWPFWTWFIENPPNRLAA